MKKIILLLFIGALTFNVSAQSNSLTAGIGLLNAKVRIQYEHGFGDMHSTGANLGLYLQGNAGQRLEGFYRIYFGGDNEKGMFFQATAGAGMFSYIFGEDDLLISDASGNFLYNDDGDKFTSFGGSIGMGGKVTSRGGFVFESTMGYHFWSPPPANYSSDYDDFYVSTGSALETLGYYVVGPGFPLHFQIKLGYNF
jgi:hypothetical protein